MPQIIIGGPLYVQQHFILKAHDSLQLYCLGFLSILFMESTQKAVLKIKISNPCSRCSRYHFVRRSFGLWLSRSTHPQRGTGTERETDRESQRGRGRETERQTQREREREGGREREREREREGEGEGEGVKRKREQTRGSEGRDCRENPLCTRVCVFGWAADVIAIVASLRLHTCFLVSIGLLGTWLAHTRRALTSFMQSMFLMYVYINC